LEAYIRKEVPLKMKNRWLLLDEENIESPALIYYKDIIASNTDLAIKIAGGTGRLWPHVKTHKMRQLVGYLMRQGIERFKCATVAEAEMLARCGVKHILIAYPLVGPNIARFAGLLSEFGGVSSFWAIGDDVDQLALLGRSNLESGHEIKVLADVNVGMNRTGVELKKLKEFCMKCRELPGISLQGLHCYDGHLTAGGNDERFILVREKVEEVCSVRDAVAEAGQPLPVMVMGGTPTFTCHAKLHNFYLSPGTLFVHDYGYKTKFPDLEFTPGAALLTRVVSHPAEGLFTIDLGSKAISADQHGAPGALVDLPDAEPAGQSEEHWVFRMKRGDAPPTGTVLYVLPRHICPTNALYPFAYVAENGRITDRWEITARDRKIEF